MKPLGVTTVQLFLKVSSAISSAENFQSHGYFEWTKKGFHCFCPDGTSGAPYATSQGCYDIDEDRWSVFFLVIGGSWKHCATATQSRVDSRQVPLYGEVTLLSDQLSCDQGPYDAKTNLISTFQSAQTQKRVEQMGIARIYFGKTFLIKWNNLEIFKYVTGRMNVLVLLAGSIPGPVLLMVAVKSGILELWFGTQKNSFVYPWWRYKRVWSICKEWK